MLLRRPTLDEVFLHLTDATPQPPDDRHLRRAGSSPARPQALAPRAVDADLRHRVLADAAARLRLPLRRRDRGAGRRRLPAYLLPGMFALSMLFGVETTMAAVATTPKRGITDRFRSMPISSVAVPLGRAAATSPTPRSSCRADRRRTAGGLAGRRRPRAAPCSPSALLLGCGSRRPDRDLPARRVAPRRLPDRSGRVPVEPFAWTSTLTVARRELDPSWWPPRPRRRDTPVSAGSTDEHAVGPRRGSRHAARRRAPTERRRRAPAVDCDAYRFPSGSALPELTAVPGGARCRPPKPERGSVPGRCGSGPC